MKQSLLEKYQSRLQKFRAESGSFWQPEVGVNNIRVLPPLKSDEEFYHECRQHFIQGAGDKGQAVVVACSGENCKTCKALMKLAKSDDDEDQQMVDRCRPVSVFFLNIVDLNRAPDEVQVYKTTSVKVVPKLLEYYCDAEWGDFYSAKKGHNVKLTVEKKGGRNNYELSLKPNKTAIDPALLEKRKNLKKYALKNDPDLERKMVAFLTGNISSVDDDDEEEMQAKKAKKILKKGKKKKRQLSFKM